MQNVALTFNTGSSSIKIGVFAIDGNKAVQLGKGSLSFGDNANLHYSGEGIEGRLDLGTVEEVDDRLIAKLSDYVLPTSSNLVLTGHRVVHGGSQFRGPVLATAESLAALEALVPLAPLHQPGALRVIRAVAKAHPEVPQTISFDTAFHATQKPEAVRLAIPRSLHEAGIRRYGFHGLSYKFIARQLVTVDPDIANGRIICAHLGSGASLCAMSGGVSRDTSMGFSALDGIPMATRPGALDAGVVVHFLREHHPSPDQLEDFLYHQCGLLGVSEISGNTRELLESKASAAKEALDLFYFRIAGEIGRLAIAIGGLDALVFTAGIGENQPAVRSSVAGYLAFLGLKLDEHANDKSACLISAPESSIKVFVIQTNEEKIIADEGLEVISKPNT
ncbi:acetate/propionate family kinase [Oryzifoliimicrobium ureilyticus]|uniref:acetate/propionate family kinase n=1 Tax=Oryzifoliimicrobium ureilyticus TaxID=3113724 RepID=UPI00307641F3